MASALALSSASAMASRALPQALISIPANPTYNLAKTRVLCAQVSSHSSQFCNGGGLSLSRAAFCSYRSPISASSLRRSFVVRAEAQSDAEAVPEENVESEASVEAEAAVESVAVALAEPEEARPPRKLRTKLGDIMGILNKRAVEASQEARPSPDIRTGDVVEIKLEVPENRRRLSIYKGIVISRQNAGIHTTIRIRRIIAGVGVEIVFPLYSPSIKEIKVLKHRKVRRARLYYLRDKLPRLSTFK